MRILHVLHDFLPHHVAGVELYVDRISRAQNGSHDVALLFAESQTDAEPYQLRREKRGGRRLYEIASPPGYRSFEETYRNPAIDEPAREVLDEFAPDLVHIHHLLHLSAGIPPLVRARGIPQVMTLHDHWLACANGGQRFHPTLGRCEALDAARCAACCASLAGTRATAHGLGRRLAHRLPIFDRPLRRAASLLRDRPAAALATDRIEERWRALRELGDSVDGFLAPSRFILDEALRFGLPAEKLRSCAQGLSPDPRQEPLPRAAGARRFAFVGSPVRHKGLHVLVDAFDRLPTDAELLVAGSLEIDPPYAAELRKKARHPGIRFLGAVEPERVAALLRSVHCLVLPSIWWENASLAIREAWDAGLPVVASDLGGNREALSGGGGMLYAADRADELAKALERLYGEPGLGGSLAASAPPTPSLAAHTAELDAIYREFGAGRG